MLSALLNLVASMGAISVLAGVVSGIIFLVDTMLHWSSRTSLEPWAVTNTHAAVVHHDSNGLGNGKLHHDVTDWFIPTPSPIRVPLQTLDAPLKSSRTPRSLVGDGEYRSVMGEADDVLVPRAASEAAGVRQLMEQLVESLVSGGLDDVVLRPSNPHPQYGRIYKRHQPRLRSALTSLAYSLQMAMAQKPLSESETPGRAHAQLRSIILDLARDVAALDRHPAGPGEQNGDVIGLDGVLDAQEDFATRAYEDILATAIVNKVMERSTTRNNIKRNNNNNNNNFVSSLEVRLGSVEDSPESGTSSYNGSWTGSSHLDHSLDDVDSDPLSLMIEECIEEVTTITATSSSSASSSSLDERSEGEEDAGVPVPVPLVRRRRRRRSERRRGSSSSASLPLPPSGPPSLIAGLSFLKQRVPFPELGVDIVDVDWSSGESELSDSVDGQRPVNGLGGDQDGCRTAAPDGAERAAEAEAEAGGEEEDEGRPASCLELVTPMQSWEDNWLFQSKRVRKPAAQYAHHPVPVPMLVPNPSEDFRALIGDVDAEETSDLSECSDDALEEVVLSGMRPKADSDQFSEDLSMSEAAVRSHLDGLAETCNLELLRRAAPALSTAPVPRAARTDRTANLDGAASPPDRMSPVSKSSTPTSRSSKGRRSPHDWARDQDAEMTILYDTPTRREAPVKEAPAKQAAVKQAPAKHCAVTKQRVAADDSARPSPTPATAPQREEDAAEAYRVGPVAAALTVCTATSAGQPDGAEQLQQPEELQVVGDRKVNGESSPAAALEALDDENLFTPPRPGTIAEREHRKWLEATPLPNNPYSPENIQRRLQQRASLTGPSLLPPAASPAPSPTPGSTPGPGGLPRPVDSSLHIALRVDPDPKKYGRDFYINSRQGDQPSAGLRRAHSTTVADRRNGHLETPIAPWSSAVRTNGDGGSEDSSPVPTPSVRELAKQFLSQPAEQQPAPLPARTKPADSSKVVIVGKDSAGGPEVGSNKKAVRQVHSLTARSMSREFREGLRHLAVGRPAAAPGAQPGAQPGASAHAPAPPSPEQPSDRPDPEGARQPAESE